MVTTNQCKVLNLSRYWYLGSDLQGHCCVQQVSVPHKFSVILKFLFVVRIWKFSITSGRGRGKSSAAQLTTLVYLSISSPL